MNSYLQREVRRQRAVICLVRSRSSIATYESVRVNPSVTTQGTEERRRDRRCFQHSGPGDTMKPMPSLGLLQILLRFYEGCLEMIHRPCLITSALSLAPCWTNLTTAHSSPQYPANFPSIDRDCSYCSLKQFIATSSVQSHIIFPVPTLAP